MESSIYSDPLNPSRNPWCWHGGGPAAPYSSARETGSGRGLMHSTPTRAERAALRQAQQETAAAAAAAPAAAGAEDVDGTELGALAVRGGFAGAFVENQSERSLSRRRPPTPDRGGRQNAEATAKWLRDHDRDFFAPRGLHDATTVLNGPFIGELRYKNSRALQKSYALTDSIMRTHGVKEMRPVHGAVTDIRHVHVFAQSLWSTGDGKNLVIEGTAEYLQMREQGIELTKQTLQYDESNQQQPPPAGVPAPAAPVVVASASASASEVRIPDTASLFAAGKTWAKDPSAREAFVRRMEYAWSRDGKTYDAMYMWDLGSRNNAWGEAESRTTMNTKYGQSLCVYWALTRDGVSPAGTGFSWNELCKVGRGLLGDGDRYANVVAFVKEKLAGGGGGP